MAAKKTVLLSLDLGKNGGKKNFYSTDEINQWINTEISSYKWLEQARQSNGQINFIWEHINNQFVGIRTVLSRYQPTEETSLLRMKQYFEGVYANDALISSSSQAGNFIARLAVEDAYVAAYALGYLVNVIGQSGNWNAKALKGFNEAWAFKNGIKNNNHEKEIIENSYVEWTNVLEEIKEKKVELEKDFSQVLDGIAEIKLNYSTQHEQLILAHEIKLEETINEGNERLSNIADAYDRHMAIQSAVEYWDTRRGHHQTESKKYYRLAGMVGVLGIVLIIFLSNWVLGLEEIVSAEKNKHLTFSDVPIWGLSIVILATSLFVWVERILVRLILSHLHLETDAGERVVMAKTYIAMLRDGQTPKDDDRKLILASLFRPNTTGIINDDALPFNLDIMQKLTGGKT